MKNSEKKTLDFSLKNCMFVSTIFHHFPIRPPFILFFSHFLISGVRLQNWSKLGLYLVMATVIMFALTDSRSDVQNNRSEKPDPARAPKRFWAYGLKT